MIFFGYFKSGWWMGLGTGVRDGVRAALMSSQTLVNAGGKENSPFIK